MLKPIEVNSPALVHATTVAELCGGVHYQTLLRWRRDPKMAFPKPITINGRLYWREQELRSWLMSREVANESAA
jgi:predicted DNA-binding transcriptional regulator AlpA